MRERNCDKHWYISYLVITICVFIFYFPLFMPDTALQIGDYLDQNVPNRVYATSCLNAGYLPMWTNHIFAGYPFLSDPQTSVFYPVNLLMAYIFPHPGTSSIMDMYVFLHWIFMGLGAVFLSRSFGMGHLAAVVSALILLFNGYNINHFSHFVIINAIAYCYWALGCIIRAKNSGNIKWSLLAGLLFSCSIFIGQPQPVYYVFCGTCLGCTAFVIRFCIKNNTFSNFMIQKTFKEKLTALSPAIKLAIIFLLPMLIGGLGSMIQILPTQELAKLSVRNNLDIGAASFLSIPRMFIPSLLFPNLYSPIIWHLAPQERFGLFIKGWGCIGMPEMLYHIGVAGFVLTFIGFFIHRKSFRAHFLFWSGVVVWLIALGDKGYLFGLLYKYLPGFGLFRIPPRIFFLMFTAWGLLAGLTVDSIWKGKCSSINLKSSIKYTAIILSGILGILGIIFIGTFAVRKSWFEVFNCFLVRNNLLLFGRDMSPEDFVRAVFSQIWFGLGMSAAVFILLIIIVRYQKHRKLFLILLSCLLFIELGVYGFHKNIAINYKGFSEVNEINFLASAQKPEGRILLQNYQDNFLRNSAMNMDCQYAGGYNPLMVKTTARLSPSENFSEGSFYEENARDLWNVSDLIFPLSKIKLKINEQSIKLSNSGALFLSKSGEGFPSELSVDLNKDKAIKAFHLITLCNDYYTTESRNQICSLSIIDTDNNPMHKIIINTGKEDVGTQEPNASDTNIHFEPVDTEPNAEVYKASVNNLPDLIGQKLTITPVSDSGIRFSHLIIEYNDEIKILNASELLGHIPSETKIHYLGVMKRKTAPGFAWLVPELVSYKLYTKDIKEIFSSKRIDVKTCAYLNKKEIDEKTAESYNAENPSDFTGDIEYKEILPHNINIKTKSNQRGWLLISMTNFPGWKAEINSKPAKIFQANCFQMAIPVESGENNINLTYRTPGLAAGASISIPVWLITIIMILIPGKKKNHQEKNNDQSEK